MTSRWRSLRTKIILWSFIPAALILTGVALVSFYAYQQVTEGLVIERDQELARLKAGELADILQEFPSQLDSIARELELQPDDAGRRSTLQQLQHRLVHFDSGVVLLNNLGQVVSAEPGRTDILGQDWSTRPYFRRLIQRSTLPAFSNVNTDGPAGKDVIAIAVPIISSTNEFLGSLVGMFYVDSESLSSFYGTILKLRLEREGVAYVIDERGTVIYASENSQISSNFSKHPIFTEAISRQSGAVRTQGLDGREILASYGPVPDTPWVLVIEEDWNNLIQLSQYYGNLLLLLLAVGVIIPTGVVMIGAKRITQPLLELVEAARQVASGNFGQTVSTKTADEVELLADQFNRMSAELKASYAQLEQRVNDRTRELSTLLQVSRTVGSTLELKPLLSLILDQLKDVVDYRHAYLAVLQENDELVLLESRGDAGELSQNALWMDPAIRSEMLRENFPLICSDLQSDTPLARRLRAILGSEGQDEVDFEIGSWMSVPLLAHDSMIGVLNLAHEQVNHYTPERSELALAFAAQAAVAIENARLFESEQRRAEQFLVLSKVSQRITSILSVDELLQQTVWLIHQSFGYYHVGIAMIEDDSAIYKAGAGALWSDRLKRFSPAGLKVGKEGITGWVAASGEALLVPDVSKEPRYVWMEGSETQSELALPVKTKERVIGVLDVQSDRLDALDESDRAVLQSLANQLAVAIENARLYEQARQLAALEERQKLARELHDSVSQALYGIALGAHTARTLFNSDPTKLAEPLDYVLSLAEAALAEMRALIFELRPESLQTEGLVAALSRQADSLRARHHIDVQTIFSSEPDLLLSAKEALYRIAQEALHNITKHARASRVDLQLFLENGQLTLQIRDDGAGFDPQGDFPGHLGLRSMRERAEILGGEFTIESSPGQGTAIRVDLPLVGR